METKPAMRRRAALATFLGSTSATLVASVQAIVLMPLYLSEIGVPLYGAWLASGELLGLMLAFDAGIPNLMIQRIGAALAARDRGAIGAFFGTGLAVLALLALALGLGLVLLSGLVPGWMGISGREAAELSGAFRLAALAFCLMLVTYAFQGLARGLQETATVHLASLAGTVAGFVATASLLISGYGLWSLAAGLAIRSGVALAGCLIFLARDVDPSVRQGIRFDRKAACDYAHLSPPLFASGLGLLAAQNSQVLMAATLLGPSSAAVFGITRKAAELAGLLLSAISHSTYGGFSHLFAQGDLRHARKVYGEITAVYLGAGLALLGAYLAVNPSLVQVWAGPELFGGTTLTLLMAGSVLATGWLHLEASMLRATDRHQQSSYAQLSYCLCRIALGAGLVLTLGLEGLPFSGIVCGLCFGLRIRHRLLRELPKEMQPRRELARIWGLRTAVVAVGAAIGWLGTPATWTSVLVSGFGVALAGGALLMFLDPMLARYRVPLLSRLARSRA